MGHILLHYAALNGHLEVVKYFIVELDCDPIHSSGANSHLVQISINVTPISAHVYSDRLAKAVSSCNNYGEQRYSDNLTAAVVISIT